MKSLGSVAHVVILGMFVVGVAFAVIYQTSTWTIARQDSPDTRSGYIQIVEVPQKEVIERLFRENPRYRFEYHYSDGYLVSSASYVGESFRLRSADIRWTSARHAECFLEDSKIYVFDEGVWKRP